VGLVLVVLLRGGRDGALRLEISGKDSPLGDQLAGDWREPKQARVGRLAKGAVRVRESNWRGVGRVFWADRKPR
jgi:hypothetical protein